MQSNEDIQITKSVSCSQVFVFYCKVESNCKFLIIFHTIETSLIHIKLYPRMCYTTFIAVRTELLYIMSFRLRLQQEAFLLVIWPKTKCYWDNPLPIPTGTTREELWLPFITSIVRALTSRITLNKNHHKRKQLKMNLNWERRFQSLNWTENPIFPLPIHPTEKNQTWLNLLKFQLLIFDFDRDNRIPLLLCPCIH